MTDDVHVEFGAATDPAVAGIHHVKESLEGLASPIQNLVGHFKEVGEVLLAAFGVEKLVQFTEHMADLAVQTQRTASLLGISTEAVSGLDALAKATGGSLEGMTMSFERLGLALARADAGSEQVRQGLHALGISAKDLQPLSLADQMGLLADKFSMLKDGIEKDAIAMAIMGRGGAAMIPIFNQGRHAIEEFQHITERAGSAMSHDMVEGLEKTHVALIENGKAWEGISLTMMQALLPAINGAIGAITDLIEWFNRSLKEGGTFKGLLDLLAGAAKALSITIMAVVFAIEGLVQVTDLALREIRDLITGNLGAAMEDVKSFNKSMEESMKSFFNRLRDLIGQAAEHHVATERDKTAKLDLLSRQRLEAQQKAIDGEINLLQQALALKTSLLDAEVGQHRITQDHKFAALQAETEKEFQAEYAALQRKLAIIPGYELAQRQETLNKLKELQGKHNAEMVKLDQQSIAAQQKVWEGYLSSVTGAFNSQLRGLLTGTTTWSQAIKGILLDLTVIAIEKVEKWGLEWAASEIARTTATTTGAASRAAAEEAAMTATLPARAAKFLSDITAESAVVFGGIFANLAPLLGPAAAGPAAVGQATVLAQLANVPKLDIGTPMVRSDGLAMLHRGEAVIPAAQVAAPGGRGGGGGPAINVTFNHNGNLTNRQLRDHAKAFAKHIADAWDSNPSLRPAH